LFAIVDRYFLLMIQFDEHTLELPGNIFHQLYSNGPRKLREYMDASSWLYPITTGVICGVHWDYISISSYTVISLLCASSPLKSPTGIYVWFTYFRHQKKKHLEVAGKVLKYETRWWFQIFFIFIPIWGRFYFD